MKRTTGDEMPYTNDAQLNDDFQMLWIDGTAGVATASLAAGDTVYADADDLVFNGPADVDDEDDDLEDDEDLDEEDEDDEDENLDDEDDFDDEEDEDDEDIDEEDEYEDDDEEDEDEDEDDE